MARVDVKIVLLGQQSIGKSCLLDRYINGFFEGHPRNTIGAAFAAKKVKVQNGRVISLGVWDTAGAERFQSISRMYYRGSKAAIVCFAPTSQQSFLKALFWAKEVTDSEPECRVYFAMTKCDLLEQLPSVGVELVAEASPSDQGDMAATPDSIQGSESSEEATVPGRQLQEVSDADIRTHSAIYRSKVFVTSAKTGIGVKQLFSTIAEDLAAGIAQKQMPQLNHQHIVRPASPNYLQSRPGPSSPLASNHNSTYTRTKRKYLPSCCS